MHRLLERLDRSFTTLVPLTYLVGLFLGTAAYFSGLVLDAGVAVGIALAFAVEVHSFLQQRRVRLLWQQLTRTLDDEAKRAALVTQLKLQMAILVGLVAFSIGNGIAFWASIAHPSDAGSWAQVVLRGVMVPVLFLATGALAPVSSDAASLLSQAADDMLYSTVKVTVRQWKKRVRKARKAGVDLAPLAIALMLDAGETDHARRIQLIADGLVRAELGGPNRPPTGGGSPQHLMPVPPSGWPEVLNLPVASPVPATAAFGVAAPNSQSMSPEEVRVRRLLRDRPELLTATLDELAAVAEVAKSTASKVRRIVLAEHAPDGQLAQ